MVPSSAFPLVRGDMWSGAGSNRRPSAFQVNRAKRCTDLRKRTSLTSGTALGGRCKIYASRTRYTPSTRQDSAPTQDHHNRGLAASRRTGPVTNAGLTFWPGSTPFTWHSHTPALATK